MIEILSLYVILYPMTMSLIWIMGSIIHYFSYERKYEKTMLEIPKVSILVPCYNEEDNLQEIIYRLDNLNYPNYEIVAINDGSSDSTIDILNELNKHYDKLKVVNSITNKGKANALHLGFKCCDGEIIVGVDADAYIDKEALNYLVPHFLTENNGMNVGAVTGNPRVRNRRNLLSKIQMGEFSSIVGMIKRTQRLSNVAMTVSGVIAAFKREALIDVGLWQTDMITEDIAVTWQLHQANWQIIYEPKAICWMLVPERLPGLWKQRVRWSQGGVEVLFRNFIPAIRNRRFVSLVLLFEQILGIIWAYSWFIYFLISLYNYMVYGFSISYFQRDLLFSVAIVQFFVAIIIESKYDERFYRTYLWIVWYPLVYWYFNAFTIIKAFIMVTKQKLFEKKQEFAVWESPDRGEVASDVEFNQNIAETVILDKNLTKHKLSLFSFFTTLIVSIYLWYTLSRDTITFITNVQKSAVVNHVAFSEQLFNYEYGDFFDYMYLTIVIGFIVLVFVNSLINFKTTKKHLKKIDVLKEEEKLFDTSVDSLKEYKQAKYCEFE